MRARAHHAVFGAVRAGLEGNAVESTSPPRKGETRNLHETEIPASAEMTLGA
jgi:hypothetical protein